MATLIIPTPLRKFTGGESIYTASASTVKELLVALYTSHDGIKKHLFDDEGELRSFIRVYLGDEDINELEGVDTKLEDRDEVSIIPAIAGGSK
ncbi:MAG TPA: MoaD/ThiS family protein [Flavobacteriales bacterium]|jgi:molybdopterin converting factor small subunit|nr:MoaD/ThiS family protein [Flavobacteriales bacterium]HIB76805.1 MoaD/ThiS family protein [Flavobacteriales bacterium]HIN41006.1 MoaD/ThiS family protein [Flavobacteriales bacterium]HIO15562.1 MoaD/ThiS family protein [Flavobacteriales bacterium]HIO58775.1 MoaD/ThiS family protein [Flavobacteriales bacterium]